MRTVHFQESSRSIENQLSVECCGQLCFFAYHLSSRSGCPIDFDKGCDQIWACLLSCPVNCLLKSNSCLLKKNNITFWIISLKNYIDRINVEYRLFSLCCAVTLFADFIKTIFSFETFNPLTLWCFTRRDFKNSIEKQLNWMIACLLLWCDLLP